MLGPILVGERITLGPILPEYLPNYCRWFADLEITAYLKTIMPFTLKQEEEWLERVARSETDVVWAILADGEHIGGTGLHRINWIHRRAMSGIAIGERRCWGRGYATEAMRLRTAFAFENLGLEKVWTTVLTENVASRRALEKVGYREVGIQRRHHYRLGRWQDEWLGEILREDWERTRGHVI
jgi:[ribosomal protein S5]-alanine N-acetyltransferase